MPSTQDDELYRQLVYTLGPWIIGAFFDILLQGVLFCQFANYLARYPDDKKLLKVAVYALMIMTTLKSIQCFVIVWYQSVVYFTDLEGARQLPTSKWWHAGNPLMVACIDIYVQSYFIYRLWVISRHLWVVIPVAMVLLFAFVAQVLVTCYILAVDYTHIRIWFGVHLSTVFVGDFLITSLSVYFLLRVRRDVLKRMKRLLDQLILLTFQSAAPASICAMANLITSQMWAIEGIMSNAFNTVLPKLYAVSMLYTLNSRQSLNALDVTELSSINIPTLQGWRTGQPCDDFELGFTSDTQNHARGEVSNQSAKQLQGDSVVLA